MLLADAASVITISPWWCLAAAIPVLLLGELLVKKIPVLAKVSIPAAVVGGMLIALAVLIFKLSGSSVDLQLKTKITTSFWTFLTTTQEQWQKRPAIDVQQPFLIAFFCCVGLNASWSMAKRGSTTLFIYLAFCALLTVVQNGAGALAAWAIGQKPELGLLCGGVSLMGGFGTAAGLKDDFERQGVFGADVIGVTAATYGVVVGCIIGGPIASLLVRRHKLSLRNDSIRKSPETPAFGVISTENIVDENKGDTTLYIKGRVPFNSGDESDLIERSVGADAPGHRRGGHVAAVDNIVDVTELEPEASDGGFLDECAALIKLGRTFVLHLIILLLCMKAGAWVSVWLGKTGLSFPVQMGAMLVGVLLRNVLDAAGYPIIKTRVVELLSGVALGIFLTVFMITLDLSKLRAVAGPMLILLVMQTILNASIAYWLLFRAMGKTYESAALSAGYIGFGLGSTSNAVATLKALAREYGPAPRAMLIVTVVGGFLIDFINILVISGFLNWFKK